jgi:hypothetical protein
VSAKVSFQNFKQTDFSDETFKVPENYTEENIFEKMSNINSSNDASNNNAIKTANKSDGMVNSDSSTRL